MVLSILCFSAKNRGAKNGAPRRLCNRRLFQQISRRASRFSKKDTNQEGGGCSEGAESRYDTTETTKVYENGYGSKRFSTGSRSDDNIQYTDCQTLSFDTEECEAGRSEIENVPSGYITNCTAKRKVRFSDTVTEFYFETGSVDGNNVVWVWGQKKYYSPRCLSMVRSHDTNGTHQRLKYLRWRL